MTDNVLWFLSIVVGILLAFYFVDKKKRFVKALDLNILLFMVLVSEKIINTV